MSLQRLADFGDHLSETDKEMVAQYKTESLAFDKIFTKMRNKSGYLTKTKFLEMGADWCTQTGYSKYEVMTRLKNLDLDRDYLVDVLGLTMVPEKKARERTHMAAYIMNTMRALEGRKKLKIPHSDSLTLEFDSDGDLNWHQFEALMSDMKRNNDVWYLLQMMYPSKDCLEQMISIQDNPSPPMREIIKKRMDE